MLYVYYLREPLRTTTRHTTHTHTDRVVRGGTREDRQGPAGRGSPRIISGGAWWACSTARRVGPFVGTLSAEEDDKDVTGGEKRSPLQLASK